MPNGNNNRHHWTLVDHPSDAPLEANIFLGHVHLSLGKDVHPVTGLQLVYTDVDGGLINAAAPNAGDTLAVHEECRVGLVGEANVVGGQAPANSFCAANIL